MNARLKKLCTEQAQFKSTGGRGAEFHYVASPEQAMSYSDMHTLFYGGRLTFTDLRQIDER